MTMTSVMIAKAALLLIVCLCRAGAEDPGWVSSTTKGFTQKQKDILVQQHNHFRSLAGAKNMAKMRWDPVLGARAQAAAARCQLRHTPRGFRRTPAFWYAGENIKATTTEGFHVEKVVKDWYSEVKDYDIDTAKCRPGKACGHYTQVTWASTYALGCGVARCDPIIGWGRHRGLVLFCLYGPGGNRGRRPPFTPGPPCSACPHAAPYCEDGLCANKPVLPLVDPNKLCRKHKGRHSFMCLNPFFYNNNKPSGDAVCGAVHCSVSRRRDRCEAVQAVDGIPCGVGQMCREGRCQFDNSGATSNKTEDCLFGDQLGVLDWSNRRGDKIPCEKYLANHGAGVCASEGVRQLCCEACDRARDPDHPDCPYGDKYASWCRQMLLHHGKRWLCSLAPRGLAKACCGTCSSDDSNDQEDAGHAH